MSFQQLLGDLKKKIYAPVYFLHGEEDYFTDRVVEYMEENILNEGEKEFNQSVLYGKDLDVVSLVSYAKRYPMMANHQLVIVKEAQDIRNLIRMTLEFENVEIRMVTKPYIDSPDKARSLVAVIEAAARHTLRHDAPFALIEATSNQVNQDGGYTGMTPAAFRDFVFGIADRIGLPRARIVLGGDHLGPNAWKSLPAEAAMAKAEVMIDAYVRAGFRKIHLDCSMSCSGDPVPLFDDTVATRAARLCAASASLTEALT